MFQLRHVLIIYCALMVITMLALTLIMGKSGAERLDQLLLLDDGYTRIAKSFIKDGGNLLHQEV